MEFIYETIKHLHQFYGDRMGVKEETLGARE